MPRIPDPDPQHLIRSFIVNPGGRWTWRWGPSLVFLHGTLIRHFMHVKENIFGEDQRYTPMDQQEQEGGAAPADPLEKKKEGTAAGGGAVDLRQYRPLNVILDITVHDLQVSWKEF